MKHTLLLLSISIVTLSPPSLAATIDLAIDRWLWAISCVVEYEPTYDSPETYQLKKANAKSDPSTSPVKTAMPLTKSNYWQTIEIALSDLRPLDDKSPRPAANWQFLTEFGLVAQVRANSKSEPLAGTPWTAARQLRNLRWVGGEYSKQPLLPGAKVSEEEFRRTFQAEIDKSIEQENATHRGSGKMHNQRQNPRARVLGESALRSVALSYQCLTLIQ